MSMKGRTWQSEKYRYGFNGKEKSEGDDFYDFEARGYYEKIGRFTSVDAKFKVFPNVSPYVYALNNPIILIDDDGNLPILPILVYVLKNFTEGAATDVVIQMMGAYLFGDAQNINEAWAEVNVEQAIEAGLVNLIKNKHATAIVEGASSTIHYITNSENPTSIGAAKEFLIGGGSAYLGEWVSKLKFNKVVAGLKKAGIHPNKIKEMLKPIYKGKLDEVRKKAISKLGGRAKRKFKDGEGNVALAEVEINGKSSEVVAISGETNPEGFVQTVDNPQYETHPTKNGSLVDRSQDTEAKILESATENLNTNASGTITIFSQNPACSSCRNVAEKVEKKYKNIKVNIIHIGK